MVRIAFCTHRLQNVIGSIAEFNGDFVDPDARRML
jgi:hypothetical protein